MSEGTQTPFGHGIYWNVGNEDIISFTIPCAWGHFNGHLVKPLRHRFHFGKAWNVEPLGLHALLATEQSYILGGADIKGWSIRDRGAGCKEGRSLHFAMFFITVLLALVFLFIFGC